MRHTRTFGRFTTAFSPASLDPPSSVVLKAAPFADPVQLPSNVPFTLDNPDTVLVVGSGEVDLFYVSGDSESYKSVRRYIGTIWSGEVVAGIRSEVDPDARLVAVGFGGATVYPVSFASIDDLSPPNARTARALAVGLAETIGRAMHRASRTPASPVEIGDEPFSLKRGAVIASPMEVLWFAIDDGSLLFGGEIPLSTETNYFPLARGMWLTGESESTTLEIVDTQSAVGLVTLTDSVSRAWRVFLEWIARRGEIDDTADRERLGRKVEGERAFQARALASLSTLLRDEAEAAPRDSGADPFLDAMNIVGTAGGIVFQTPPGWITRRRKLSLDESGDLVTAVCDTSRVRCRRVVLRGRWWRADAGPLIAFSAGDHRAVALTTGANGAYILHDLSTGTRTPLAQANAGAVEPVAYTFYRPAPGRALQLKALGALVSRDVWPEFRRVLGLAMVGAVLGLAMPIVMGKMFNDVIPSGAMGNALTLFSALIAVAIGSAAFDLARAFALVRVEGKSTLVLQSAIVDRLLALPAQFFRQYTVGDLTIRADAVNAARQLLTGVAITSLLGGALTLTSLGLMWWISGKLALIAAGVLVIGAGVTLLAGIYTLPFERKRQALEGGIGALVFEMLGGIAKLHVAAAEPRMFAIWGMRFADLKRVAFRAGIAAAALTAFNDVLPLLASGVLFVIAAKIFATPGNTFATGDFIAFYASFGAALAAGTAVSNTLVSVLNVIPLIERAGPILATAPEVDEAKPDAGPIGGRIELAHVSFGYVADAPPIVDDVSFEIRPGEFVAFVGPSGAGKSTILRLLLGFERPERGAVYYDGHDLASIDVAAIRRQCAVVLQQSKLLAGDIFTNIIGASPLTIEDAWRAAELAGLADDIRAMPMGMHTVVSEGGSTLSGGQRQRLLIARALVRNPRVVFFDEATSALDNRSQEIVTRSLEQMRASRIVIAHRLTTVQRADRIFVMQAGRIVQQGTYDELLAREGLFQHLAKRQLV